MLPRLFAADKRIVTVQFNYVVGSMEICATVVYQNIE